MGTKIRTGLINFSLPTIPTTRWRWKFGEWKWKHFTHSLDWRSFLDFKHCFNGNDTKDHSYCNYSNFVQHICSKLRNSSFFSLPTSNSQMSKSRVSGLFGVKGENALIVSNPLPTWIFLSPPCQHFSREVHKRLAF